MLNLLGDLWFTERATSDEVTVPGYADEVAGEAAEKVDAQAAADVDRLLARAEAAIAQAPADADAATSTATSTSTAIRRPMPIRSTTRRW